MTTEHPDPTSAIQDNSLSLEARGLYAWLRESGPGNLNIEMIARGTGIGATKATRIRRELVSRGYLTQQRSHNARGQMTWDWALHETPVQVDEAKAS